MIWFCKIGIHKWHERILAVENYAVFTLRCCQRCERIEDGVFVFGCPLASGYEKREIYNNPELFDKSL